jgi:hypothetical protein
MRKEVNLEIELEILGSEIESFCSQKIEDPIFLPFKLFPFPTCKSSIHHPLFAIIQTNTLKWIHEMTK